MQTIMHTNVILDVKSAFMIHCIQFLTVQRLFRCDQCERQPSVNDVKSYTFGNQWAAFPHSSIINISVAVIAKKQMTRSFPDPKNEPQQSVNDFWH
jgi:hypothetical protein